MPSLCKGRNLARRKRAAKEKLPLGLPVGRQDRRDGPVGQVDAGGEGRGSCVDEDGSMPSSCTCRPPGQSASQVSASSKAQPMIACIGSHLAGLALAARLPGMYLATRGTVPGALPIMMGAKTLPQRREMGRQRAVGLVFESWRSLWSEDDAAISRGLPWSASVGRAPSMERSTPLHHSCHRRRGLGAGVEEARGHHMHAAVGMRSKESRRGSTRVLCLLVRRSSLLEDLKWA
jgi:hypothetical protein